jgi:hypothetical protein
VSHLSAPGRVVCAFAVTRTPPPADVLAATPGHAEGGPLRVLPAGDLYLVVQDVPAASFDEAALTERLNRPADLEDCARAHHRGVEAAARTGPVVPLPLATLYRADHTAATAVTSRAAELGALLDRLRGRTEWAVKVHAAEADGPADPAPAGVDGRSYLSRASARRRIRQDSRGRAAAGAEAVDRELRRYAVAATRHRPQSEQLTGRRAPQLLNAAYLVDDTRRTGFTAALSRLRADGGAAGVELHASGPWIPYSFATWDSAGDPPCDSTRDDRESAPEVVRS